MIWRAVPWVLLALVLSLQVVWAASPGPALDGLKETLKSMLAAFIEYLKVV